MYAFGLIIGITTLFIIGMGFLHVTYGERYFGYLWWPYMMSLGFLIVFAPLFISSDGLSVVVGVLAATFVWGWTELREQAVRAELGWFPFNANRIIPPFEEIIRKWKALHL